MLKGYSIINLMLDDTATAYFWPLTRLSQEPVFRVSFYDDDISPFHLRSVYFDLIFWFQPRAATEETELRVSFSTL
jgi:hypothetical protein